MKILSLSAIVATLFTSVFARSSVHMVSNANTQQEPSETKPEVSMNAFSMFYSHMMDTSASHPAFHLQQDANEALNQVASFLPQSNDMFTRKVNNNLMIIISGVQSPQDILSTETSFFVSDDDYESYSNLVEDTFEQMSSEDVTITTYKNQKTKIRQGDDIIPVASRLEQESFEYFKTDFADLDTSVFDMSNEVDKMFVTEVEDVRDIYSSDRKYEPSDMRLIEMNSLQKLAQEYGLDSKQYKEAHLVLKNLLETYIIPKVEKQAIAATFILTPYQTKRGKRDMPRINNLAVNIEQESVCYKTASACRNATNNCSSNGQCTSIGSCFTCQCKSSSYVGESCQYINAVADFQLLFWTSVLLIVITASVVVCVYQSGNMVDGGIIMARSLPKQE